MWRHLCSNIDLPTIGRYVKFLKAYTKLGTQIFGMTALAKILVAMMSIAITRLT